MWVVLQTVFITIEGCFTKYQKQTIWPLFSLTTCIITMNKQLAARPRKILSNVIHIKRMIPNSFFMANVFITSIL